MKLFEDETVQRFIVHETLFEDETVRGLLYMKLFEHSTSHEPVRKMVLFMNMLKDGSTHEPVKR